MKHRTRYTTNPWPRHYFVDCNTTVEWLGKLTEQLTVVECNLWKGTPEDVDEGTQERIVVLMECDHNAILKISKLLYEQDPGAWNSLLCVLNWRYTAGYGKDAIFGYDFQRNEPRVILYPATSLPKKS